MRVLVAGAIGAVGRNLLPRLVAAGHEVVGTTRSEEKAGVIRRLGGASDWRNFDRTFALTNRLRTEGTDYLLSGARELGVKRFIAQSFCGCGCQFVADMTLSALPCRSRVAIARGR